MSVRVNKSRPLLLALSLVCGLLAQDGAARADQTYASDAVKAAFLYRFTGYVRWPAAALDGPRFTIAVLCADEVADQLATFLPEHRIGNLPAQVKRLRSIAELGDSQMLYVGAGCLLDLRRVLAVVDHRPVLIVTDDEAGLDDGGIINFIMADGHVRFEVSLTSARRAGLVISSGLLSVATRVIGDVRSRIWCAHPGARNGGLAQCAARVARR